jgi:hypothetical protein
MGPVTNPTVMSVLSHKMRAMSDHYEVVFSCFLRDDTPAPVLAACAGIWALTMKARTT